MPQKTLERLQAIADEAALVDREAEGRLHEKPAFGYVTADIEAYVGERLRDARTPATATPPYPFRKSHIGCPTRYRRGYPHD